MSPLRLCIKITSLQCTIFSKLSTIYITSLSILDHPSNYRFHVWMHTELKHVSILPKLWKPDLQEHVSFHEKIQPFKYRARCDRSDNRVSRQIFSLFHLALTKAESRKVLNLPPVTVFPYQNLPPIFEVLVGARTGLGCGSRYKLRENILVSYPYEFELMVIVAENKFVLE